MSEEVVNLTIKVAGKEYGEFEIPYTVELETDDKEDWYREVYNGSREPAWARLNALGFSDPFDESSHSATVTIVDEEDNIYWAYELHQEGGYGSLSHVTIPDAVAYDPSLPPKRLRNV